MKKLILKQEGDWIAFESTNAAFINRVKVGLGPGYRKYDSKSRKWLVLYTKGSDLVGLASKYYQVDWGELPGAWQMLIVGGRGRSTTQVQPVAPSRKSPYATLHLLDTAPPLVVRVVYKALLLEHHPDHNDGVGDRERLNEVIEAYRKITRKGH